MAAKKVCKVEGCGNATGIPGTARGLCRSHYKRWRRHGDPLAGGTAMNARPAWIEAHKGYAGDDCLLWPFSRGEHGYGQFKVKRASTPASRAMCIAAHGKPPSPRHHAAHTCGNGHLGCVNPKHLRWATAAENAADKVDHGTVSRGEAHGQSFLTADKVRQIRAATGFQRDIAARFGVSRQHVGKIRRGELWAWLE